MKSSTSTPHEQGSVRNRIEALQHNLSLISNAVEVIEDKINPILSFPVPEKEITTGLEQTPSCELEETLNNAIARTHIILANLEKINSRIEL